MSNSSTWRTTDVVMAIVLALGTSAVRGESQWTLPSIELLPDAPATYLLRNWQAVAENFDALAFNTTAVGQFLPLVRIDATPQSAALQTSFGLPAYVGETRVFGETGEPIHEAIASLGAVLGGTLAGIDKSAGPDNWVSMTREYVADRNGHNVVLNTPFSASGGSAWYDIYPNILFYAIADRYPGETYLAPIQDEIDEQFLDAVNVLTANGTAPNFNYTAYNFKTEQPVLNGVWREPDMGLGMAWMQQAAYWRQREANPALAASHLQAVDRALSYYQQRTTNPDYEILTPFGAYAAARMNAEHGRNYDVQKLVGWVFSRSAARPTKIMISGEQWGGQDVGGLLGFTLPNSSDVRGYAFSMNTFATAIPTVPLARYEDRFSRAVGKWMLNAASAARLFYANAHSAGNQSSESWLGDPQSAVAYEGLRHHWLDEFDSQELYAAGDPLVYNWGPQTDFALYGGGYVGAFGAIIKPTNVAKILQLDLLATDFYRDTAYPTYLYYNPHPTAQSVAIDLGADRLYDLYDLTANRFLKRGVSGTAFFDVPADDAVSLVVVPAGGEQSFVGRRMLVDGVTVDYNATMLPGNLIANGDADVAAAGNPNRPGFWHGSSAAVWSAEEALSPSRSLALHDQNTAVADEWRSYAAAIPAGADRTLTLRWFWKYDAQGEFAARLRLSDDPVGGVDLTNPTTVLLFPVTGFSGEFQMFETTLTLPAAVRSFDLTFLSGALGSATGTLFVDDVSVSLAPTHAYRMLAGDVDGDGAVDAADLALLNLGFGPNFDGADVLTWQRQWTGTPELLAVPEPAAFLSAMTCLLGGVRRQLLNRCRATSRCGRPAKANA